MCDTCPVCLDVFDDNKKFKEDEVFELSINSGAKDCLNLENYHEIISEKEDFYKVKNELEKKLIKLEYSGIEWRPLSRINLNEEQSKKISELILALEELDDVQNVYINANLKNILL